MKILFIHQNFPGQFRRFALHLSRNPAYRVLAIGKQGCPMLDGVRTLTYSLHRPAGRATHSYAKPLESAVLHGQAVVRILLRLKSRGYTPDAIVAHPGWGETLFVKEIYPHARLIHYSEYYYQGHGADLGFDPETPVTLDDLARVRTKNAALLLSLEGCDIAMTPTQWQKSLHPRAYHDKIRVIHEGIDTDVMRPDGTASFVLPDGRVLRHGDPVITYVARNLEPYRGFHILVRALPEILKRNPNCTVVVVGADGASYGPAPQGAPNWRSKLLAGTSLDPARVHFLGQIPYARYRSLLQVSAAHIYLTYPFVLSWSLLEAMACGCVLIGSATAPVEEVIVHGDNGLLVDFFDHEALAAAVSEVLAAPERFLAMRVRAAATVAQRYSLAAGIAGYLDLLENPSMA